MIKKFIVISADYYSYQIQDKTNKEVRNELKQICQEILDAVKEHGHYEDGRMDRIVENHYPDAVKSDQYDLGYDYIFFLESNGTFHE